MMAMMEREGKEKKKRRVRFWWCGGESFDKFSWIGGWPELSAAQSVSVLIVGTRSASGPAFGL